MIDPATRALLAEHRDHLGAAERTGIRLNNRGEWCAIVRGKLVKAYSGKHARDKAVRKAGSAAVVA